MTSPHESAKVPSRTDRFVRALVVLLTPLVMKDIQTPTEDVADDKSTT
jgi:hypothetical protein